LQRDWLPLFFAGLVVVAGVEADNGEKEIRVKTRKVFRRTLSPYRDMKGALNQEQMMDSVDARIYKNTIRDMFHILNLQFGNHYHLPVERH
jgi:hypothetical protein